MNNRALVGDLMRPDGVPQAKGQMASLNELFEKDIRKDERREVTAVDGRLRFKVPLLTSEECLDTCKEILEEAHALWERLNMTVEDVRARIEGGDKVYQDIFGELTDEDLANTLALIKKQNENILSKDDAIAKVHRGMALDIAFRDVRQDVPEERLSWAIKNSRLDEIGDMIEIVNAQVGLGKYIEDREMEDLSEEDKKK